MRAPWSWSPTAMKGWPPTTPLRVAVGELSSQRSTRRIRLPRCRWRRWPARSRERRRRRHAAPAHRRQPLLCHRGAADSVGGSPALDPRRGARAGRRTRPGRAPRSRHRRADRHADRAGAPGVDRGEPSGSPSTSWSTPACSSATATGCGSGTRSPGCAVQAAVPPHRARDAHRADPRCCVARAAGRDRRRAAGVPRRRRRRRRAGPRARTARRAPRRPSSPPIARPKPSSTARSGRAPHADTPHRRGPVRRLGGRARPASTGGRTPPLRAGGPAAWREIGDRVREGDTLRRLSRTMWRLCRGDEAAAAAARSDRGARTRGPATRARLGVREPREPLPQPRRVRAEASGVARPGPRAGRGARPAPTC